MSSSTSSSFSSLPISASTWFITGISRGLGRSIATEVMQRGGRVAGTVRNLSDAGDLRQRFPNRLWLGTLDLSDLANIPMVFQSAVEQFGRMHAVVSNAGYSLLGAAEELDLAAIRHIVDTNLTGSIQLARAAVAHMRPLGGGRLIQISSGAGQAAFAGLSAYCATKWGIEGFFEALSQEVAGFGIGTTLVEPGAIRTDFGASGVLSPELEAYRESPAGLMRQMAHSGYVAPGDPAKMAKAIVDTFEVSTAPPRLALGPDVHGYIKTALTTRLVQLESFQDVTMSTDCDDVGAR
ncbi:SDR family oxidoreductase [uncultured Paludibaculum sp.]|uniref:SDR family oxidoreductase n=1 Tax=uncultured Paludibaculum sp. TaxID=1765020 RepID=UPI002AAACCF4|nr:SDR family oxidoreductase [uncultured Paludibaculum sp.]